MGAGVTDTTEAPDRARADVIGRRYMIRFEEDTLKQRPLWTRVIIEFLGTAPSASVATARRQSHRTKRHRSPFTGGTIDKVVFDVSGQKYVDHEAQVCGWLMRD